MSHCRKNLLRDKVIGKKWIYLGINTLYRQNVGHLRNQEWPWEKYTPQTRVWAVLEGECSLKRWCGYVLWLGSAGKESTCNVGDLGLIPGLGRSPGEGKGYSLQYFGLENSMDCTVHGVEKSQTQLSDFHS